MCHFLTKRQQQAAAAAAAAAATAATGDAPAEAALPAAVSYAEAGNIFWFSLYQ